MTIELTDREIELVKNALEYIYDETPDAKLADELTDIWDKCDKLSKQDLLNSL